MVIVSNHIDLLIYDIFHFSLHYCCICWTIFGCESYTILCSGDVSISLYYTIEDQTKIIEYIRCNCTSHTRKTNSIIIKWKKRHWLALNGDRRRRQREFRPFETFCIRKYCEVLCRLRFVWSYSSVRSWFANLKIGRYVEVRAHNFTIHTLSKYIQNIEKRKEPSLLGAPLPGTLVSLSNEFGIELILENGNIRDIYTRG